MTTLIRDITPANRNFDSSARQTPATIASVSDQDFYVTRTYGIFHIPARPADEACALLIVTPRGDAIDLGDNRRFPFAISAHEIAADIIQDLTQHGIFVCAGERPSETELSAAGAMRDAWYRQLINEADEMWARGHSYREISDMHRRAAIFMKLEREWAYVPQRSVECPACGEKVRAGVAICKHCKAVLDSDRAAKFFPNGPREKFASGPSSTGVHPHNANSGSGPHASASQKSRS
jgi:hypothetical protein